MTDARIAAAPATGKEIRPRWPVREFAGEDVGVLDGLSTGPRTQASPSGIQAMRKPASEFASANVANGSCEFSRFLNDSS
jgi:hypothetical protein